MKDQDFTFATTKRDSQIKKFSELINPFSDHLQNVIKTINAFKEHQKKPQHQFDKQAETYLTCNYFEMKLVSNKEYLQAQNELKKILQKIIKVQQQAQKDKQTQKTKQNQIIAELTDNILSFSDLLEKIKNLNDSEKICYIIEYESKKKCNIHLDQLKEYLNVCVNNLEKFVQINQNIQAENKFKEYSKKCNQQLQLVNQQLKLQKLTVNQLKQTVTVIEQQLRGMIFKTQQNWLYKHYQMGVKEEKKKKKRSELSKQKNELIIKQSQVKLLQMVNMIDYMNEYIVSLASETYSELLDVKIQFLKMEMINKNQHPQKYNVIYLKEVSKLLEQMNYNSYTQQKELKQLIQQFIKSQTQESCKKNIAELEAKYKIAVENQIKIKDKQINELNQLLQSSLKVESQKLKTLNNEMESKMQQIYQIQNQIQKNSFEQNNRFKQEKEKLEVSIKQRQQKIRDLQNKLQFQKSKIKTLQKQHLKSKNNNNDSIIDLQATFQQNDKLKRLLQDTKRELNTIKNSATLKESELNKLKQQLNNLNSTIQSLRQQIFNNQLIITQLNHQLSIKKQHITNLNNSINQIKSQSTTKISSLTQQLSTKTSQLQDIQSNFNQQKQYKQFKTVELTQKNYQIQILDIHKREQQTNQNTIKLFTQIIQSNIQTINSLQNEILSLKKEVQSLQQNNTQISTENTQNKQLIAQLTTLKDVKQKQIDAQIIKINQLQQQTKSDLIKITSLKKDKQNLTIQLTKINQNFVKIKTQNKEKLNQLNLQIKPSFNTI